MSLDLTRVVSQIGAMVSRLKAGSQERQEHLRHALDTLHSQADNLEALDKKIKASRTTWLVAGLVDGLDRKYQPLPLPTDFSVIATDGSHIDVDRHRSARCYLINIGSVVLRYGANPAAVLGSMPHLYADDDNLVITPAGIKGREQPVEGMLLGIKRSVDECRRLVELAAEVPAGSSALALLDGSLIMWSLAAYPEFVTEALLDNGFLSCLEEIRRLNQDKNLALASYISFPRSNDVVNALRVALCPHEVVDSDRYCLDCKQRECDAVAGVRDRELFSSILEPGQRSALFVSQSSILRRYGAHLIHFFYIRVEDEIARVEIPRWVATDDNLLNLAHTLVYDQCRRGQEYPVALSEAHEKAVVTGTDRENFWQLVESTLVEEHLPIPGSAKSKSKRTRWI